MDKLNKIKAEKFRILKDAELKEIFGLGYLNDSVGSCSQNGSSCGGGCSANSSSQPYYFGECYYSSIARCCVCNGASGGDPWW